MKQNELLSWRAIFLGLCICAGINYLLFFSPFHVRDTSSFSLKEEVVRIPLVIENRRFYSYVMVENDTIRMMIDTGSTHSLLNHESTTGVLQITWSTDGGGFRRFKPIRRVNKMQWGGLKIENLLILPRANIIGDNILRHYIVQFNNENREIILTRNSSLVEKRGIRVPFSRGRGDVVIVTLSLNGKEGDFLLDTGYTGELRVDADFFYSSGLSDLENVRWRGYLGGSAFMPTSLWGEGMVYMTTARLELDDRIFDNVIVARCIHWYTNIIGYAFLQRFRTFTIDYLNGYIYFELPEDNSFVSFSDNPIEAVPVAYLDLLHWMVNTFGITPQWTYPFRVIRLLKDDAFSEIEIGDTLMGINQVMFNQVAFDKLPDSDKDSFTLIMDTDRQIAKLEYVFSRNNEATFHFLKNGELISIDRVRCRISYPPPAFAYNFRVADGGFSMFAPLGRRLKPNFYLHFPLSTLTGREKYFTILRDGEEIVISNIFNPLFNNAN